VTRYFVGRLLQIVPVVFGVTIVVFVLVRLIPGDPITSLLVGRATPEFIMQARQQLHLNEPIWQQYWDYMAGAAHGDFGVSFFYQTSVWKLTIPRVPTTLELLAYSSLLSVLMTFPIATLAAAKRGRGTDQAIRLAFTTALGVPSFWLGLELALYLGVRVRLFPIVGAGSGGLDTLYHLTLPALTIALAMAPLQVRALRSSLIEVMNADYLLTARANGLRRRFVIWSYLWRNSLLPLITVFSVNLGWLIGGTVVVEQVFTVPGLGSLLINSIATRDYAIIQLVTAILALLIIVTNFLTDVVYVLVDPRVALHS
jgi:ABC-type dipeptide/oligopeptide/nickel transport system permease component